MVQHVIRGRDPSLAETVKALGISEKRARQVDDIVDRIFHRRARIRSAFKKMAKKKR